MLPHSTRKRTDREAIFEPIRGRYAAIRRAGDVAIDIDGPTKGPIAGSKARSLIDATRRNAAEAFEVRCIVARYHGYAWIDGDARLDAVAPGRPVIGIPRWWRCLPRQDCAHSCRDLTICAWLAMRCEVDRLRDSVFQSIRRYRAKIVDVELGCAHPMP